MTAAAPAFIAARLWFPATRVRRRQRPGGRRAARWSTATHPPTWQSLLTVLTAVSA